MKDSGIEWIGEIPDDWRLTKVSRLYNVMLGKMLSPNKSSESDTLEKYLCSANVKWDGIVTDEIKEMWFSKDEKEKYLLKDGDIVVTEGGDVGVSAIYHGEVNPCYIQNAVHKVSTLNPTKTLNEFLYYWMIAVKSSGYLDTVCNKATITHFTKEKLSATPILSVPITEQIRIVNYLTNSVSCINNIVCDNESVIEKLKEYRQSIITEAVTKGLHDVPMKDSGVEWIGKVPAHWDIRKSKYVMKKIKKICLHYTNEPILSLTMAGVLVRDLDNPFGKMPLTFDGYQYLEKGNLLLCLFDIDVTPRCVGLIENNGLTSPAYSQFSFVNDAFPKYYYYFFLYLDNKKELVHLSKNLRYSISESEFGDLLIPLPPLKEQQEIADYLDKKCAAIDKLIAEKEQVIDKLEEYKKSLIYECVTGKREVPA